MSEAPRFVDHPAPSAVLMTIHLVAVIGLMAAIPVLTREGASPLSWVLILAMLGVLAFYLWPLFATSYTLSRDGIQVRYGPWVHRYPWSDFTAAYWQKGLFAMRIGWPTVTPCVRLTDGVVLKRRLKGWGLYLTPNDPKAFLSRVSQLAPDLTKETLL